MITKPLPPFQTKVQETTTINQKVGLIVGMISAFLVGMAIIVSVAPKPKTEIATVPIATLRYATPVDSRGYERNFSIPTPEVLSTSSVTMPKLPDTEIPLDIKEPIVSLSVDGSVILVQKDSYARVILIDITGREYLVADASFPFDEITELRGACQETCVMDPVTPAKLRIETSKAYQQDEQGKYIEDPTQPTASINVLKINYLAQGKTINTGVTKALVAKAQQDFKIKTFNNLGRHWVAGETSISGLSYTEKKKLFSNNQLPNLCGFEYYKNGVFEFCERSQPASEQFGGKSGSGTMSGDKAGTFTFDWRSRHDQNWMTSVKNQGGCGSCAAFSGVGAVEAGINLFFNRHLDINLSEQDVISCSGAVSCAAGGTVNGVLNYVKNIGVVDEVCYPYTGTDSACSKCANWQTKNWKITNYNWAYRTYDVKKALLERGPIGMSYGPWTHAVVLAGYGDINAQTIFYDQGGSPYTLSPSDPLINTTYWLFKNSWGSWGDSGYGRFSSIDGFLQGFDFDYIIGNIIQPSSASNTVQCTNADGDSYCFWGTGSKPASGCPSSCAGNSVPDCDDSNASIGACTNASICGTNQYLTSGETQPFGDSSGYGIGGCCGDNKNEYVVSGKCCSDPSSRIESQTVSMSSLPIGTYGTGDGQLRWPYDMAVSGSEVYVADHLNDRVVVFTTAGAYARTWGSHGHNAGNKEFDGLRSIAVSGSEVYVADTFNNWISVFTTSGSYSRKIGEGVLSIPSGVTVYNNEVYVSDTGNNRIQVFSTSGTPVRNWNSSFNGPVGITVSGGEVYVTDEGNNKVKVFNTAGTILRQWGGFILPDGVAVSGSEVFVSDQSDRIQVFSTAGAYLRKFGGNGRVQGLFGFPIGLEADGASKVYVADMENNRIQVFSSSSEQVCATGPIIACNTDADCYDDIDGDHDGIDDITCNVDHCNFAGTISARCSHAAGTCCADGTLPGSCSVGKNFCTPKLELSNNFCQICGCLVPYKCDPGKSLGEGQCVPDPTQCCLNYDNPAQCRPPKPLCPWAIGQDVPADR